MAHAETSVLEPVIDVSELTRRFGAVTALDSVCVSMPRGAVYGLVGANGAGKTTLLRILAGLSPAARGRVLMQGKRVLSLDEEKICAESRALAAKMWQRFA